MLKRVYGKILAKIMKVDLSKRMTLKEMQDDFGDKIKRGEPFLAGKLGGNEAYAMFEEEFGTKATKEKSTYLLGFKAGFYPATIENLPRYHEIMKDALSKMDYIFPWGVTGEGYFINKYCKKDVKLSGTLEVAFSDTPFSKHFEGKKVLVIHPFVETIKKQYENNREKLFSNKDVLPLFELKTLKSVESYFGKPDERFPTWFDALDYLKEEAMKIDFDIALIGCGSYGLPLAAYIKSQGRTAIHMGGSLQMLFGIKGKRWDNYGDLDSFTNEYWTVPSDAETPEGADRIEGGCYWK